MTDFEDYESDAAPQRNRLPLFLVSAAIPASLVVVLIIVAAASQNASKSHENTIAQQQRSERVAATKPANVYSDGPAVSEGIAQQQRSEHPTTAAKAVSGDFNGQAVRDQETAIPQKKPRSEPSNQRAHAKTVLPKAIANGTTVTVTGMIREIGAEGISAIHAMQRKKVQEQVIMILEFADHSEATCVFTEVDARVRNCRKYDIVTVRGRHKSGKYPSIELVNCRLE
jgi:hypothetical protein